VQFPHGNPPGRGLLFKNLGKVGASRVPHFDAPLVCVCGRATERVVTTELNTLPRCIVYSVRRKDDIYEILDQRVLVQREKNDKVE
jgi:hypothetical protein